MMNKYEYNAKIVELKSMHEELRIIRVQPEFDVESFVPGQYVEIGLLPEGQEKVTRRQYSIASAPGDSRGLELFIVRVDGGALTDPLWRLGLGDRLWVNPKIKGKFTLEDATRGKNYFFIATGTGLAPFISMLRHHRAAPPWNELTLIHGVRLPHDLGYDEELHQVQEELPSFRYLPAVTRDPAWPGLKGRIPELLENGTLEDAIGRRLDPESDQVFICGNPSMIDEAVKQLELRGFSLHKRKTPGNIHFERYW